MRPRLILLGLVLAACSGSHDQTATTQPLDPFATKAPSSSLSAAPDAAAATTASAPPAPPPIDVGQCFDTDQFVAGAPIDLSSARVVDCTGPHQQEVYAVVAQTADSAAAYPGDDMLAAFADDNCLAAFSAYTGLDYRTSRYDIANARPDEAAWERGERRVICALHDVDFAELTGSAKAAL